MNQNSSTHAEIRKALNIPIAVANTPVPIAIIESNPKLTKDIKYADTTATNATSGTIVSADTTSKKNKYIVGYEIECIKDVTATSLDASITFTQDSGTTYLKTLMASLTAEQFRKVVMFPPGHALKVDKGSAISLSINTNVANIKVHAGIFYYEEQEYGN